MTDNPMPAQAEGGALLLRRLESAQKDCMDQGQAAAAILLQDARAAIVRLAATPSPARDSAEGTEPSRAHLEYALGEIGAVCEAHGKLPLETVADFIARVTTPKKPAPDAVREALELIERTCGVRPATIAREALRALAAPPPDGHPETNVEIADRMQQTYAVSGDRWFKIAADRLRSSPSPAGSAEPDDQERAFTDICDELNCAYDNEAALIAIGDLKKRIAALPTVRVEREALIRELCGDELNGGLIRDVCFTVWKICHEPKHPDGNSDWGSDTLPTVQKAVEIIRSKLARLPAQYGASEREK